MHDLSSVSRVGCVVSGRLVVLDLVSSRYAMLRDETATVGIAPPPPPGRCAIMEWPDDAPPRRVAARERWIPQARRSADVPFAPARVGAIARLAWEERQAARTLRAGIGPGLARLADLAPASVRIDAQAALVHAAWRARRLWPVRDRCLPRSLGLARGLRRRGSDAMLVIGVSLEPFSAHAWVQDGEMVLNDMVDTVSLFTPILAA